MTPFDPLQPLERGTNLIEASAGTGKTWTITALVVRLIIEEGLSLSEALVLGREALQKLTEMPGVWVIREVDSPLASAWH